MSPSDFEFAAVVVTYNPVPTELAALLGALDEQRCAHVVIDNRSSNVDEIRTIVKRLSHCMALHERPANDGLAIALNEGIGLVDAKGFSQVLLFDQDSGIHAGFCEAMTQAWRRGQKAYPGQVAAIGPRLQDPVTGHCSPFRRFDTWWPKAEISDPADDSLFQVGFLITSGSLLDLKALTTIGPMRENYFIDNIDLEWCFRAVHKGFRIFGTDQPRLLHRIGESSRNPLVRRGLVVKHNPLRFYYSSRNRMHLYRQAHAPKIWKWRDLVRFTLKTGYLLATSSQRSAYLSSLGRALKDHRKL